MNLQRKNGVVLRLVTMVCICCCCVCLRAKASTGYTDTEPNNTSAESQFVIKNSQSASDYVSGTSSRYRYVSGTLTGKEEDWFRVSLSARDIDDTYLDMGSGEGTIFIDIYNSSMKPLYTFEHRMFDDTHSYKIEVKADDVYYIKLYQNSNLSSKYEFTVGNPKYKLGTYTYNFGTKSLQAKGTWSDKVDLGNIISIPPKAEGHRITIGGCTTSISSKRAFTNEFFQSWVATKADYTYSLPITISSALDQEWGARIISTSTKNSTISPTMRIDYVYPDV